MTKISIHDRALGAAGRFKKSETELISIIQEVDETKAFYEKECKSTYEYCIRFLKLGDNVSLDLIAIARKAKKVPELKVAIEKELITVSKARRITSVITPENSSHWLKLAENLPKQKLEKEIAKVNPKALTIEKAKYVSEHRLKLELGVSEEFMQDLKRAQEILSQKSKKHENFESALGQVLKDFLKREDPVQKAKRASKAKTVARSTGVGVETQNEQPLVGPGRVSANQRVSVTGDASCKREPFKSGLKHSLNLRDHAQCTHIYPSGERCTERKWLHFHHIQEVSKGGENNLNNLATLCTAHHRMIHQHDRRRSDRSSPG